MLWIPAYAGMTTKEIREAHSTKVTIDLKRPTVVFAQRKTPVPNDFGAGVFRITGRKENSP